MVLFLIGSGCATYGKIEENFGKSYAMAKYGQILNPAASRNLKPVTGLSGMAAEAAVNKYTDRFGKSMEVKNGLSRSTPNDKDIAGIGQDDYKK
jgi:hypothetical protein